MTNEQLFERIRNDAFFDEMLKVATAKTKTEPFMDKLLVKAVTKGLGLGWKAFSDWGPKAVGTALKHPVATVGALYAGGKLLDGGRHLVGRKGQQMNNPDLVDGEPAFISSQRRWR